MARSGKSVNETIECRGIGAREASERLLQHAAADYRAVGVGANRFQLARTFRPTWAVAVGCALTPVLVGLAFFFVRRTETWDATVEEDHRAVRIRVAGTVLPRVLLAIRQAVEQGPAPLPAPPPPVAAAPDPSRVAAWQSPAATDPAVLAPADGTPDATPDATPDPTPSPLPGSPAHVAPPPSAQAGLVLCFDTGERRPVEPEMLIGRDPAPGDRSGPAPALVAVSDPDLSVSKTHLLVRSDGRGVTVVDRGSVNGTAVEDVQGVLTPVTDGAEVHAGVGATVRFGARSFLVAEVTS